MTWEYNFTQRVSAFSGTAPVREANPHSFLVKSLFMTLTMAQRKTLSDWDTSFKPDRSPHQTGGHHGPYLLRKWTWKCIGEDTWQGLRENGPSWSRAREPPSQSVAPGSRHCDSQRFVTVWGSVIFNCFCLVFEPLIDHSCWFFFFVVVLVCLLRFLFCIWCESTSEEWEGVTSNSMFAFLCIRCFGMWLLIINI